MDGSQEVFGFSAEGRALIASYCGDPAERLRILILAGQHGDEPEGPAAAADFCSRFESGAFQAPAYFAIAADINPDGGAAGTRRTSTNIDLNRDHLLLCAPETVALHALVERFRPDLVIDLHTYRPWRKELLQYGFAFPQDIMIDFPTNPAVRTSMGPGLQQDALKFVKQRLSEADIRCERYTLIRSPIVRHSNVDVVDARNGLALRFGTPTVLIEGRRASPDDLIPFTPARVTLLRSIEALVEWAAGNSESIVQRPSERVNKIPLRCRYSGSWKPRYMEMQSATTGLVMMTRIPGKYVPRVTAIKWIKMPDAYGVPRSLAGVLAALSRQRLEALEAGDLCASTSEAYRIETIVPAIGDDFPAMALCTVESAPIDRDDFVTFPTRQLAGRLLSLLLEPESQFGPHRLPELADSLHPGTLYPIVRLQGLRKPSQGSGYP